MGNRHYRKKNGSRVAVEVRVSLICYSGRQVMSVIARDITERIQSQLKLRESEEKYRLITENANDLIGIVNQRFEIEFINDIPLQRMSGFSKEDLIGKKALDFIYPDDRDIVLDALVKGFQEGGGIIEARAPHKDGHVFWLELRGRTFIDVDGELKGIVISRDITEHKQAELELRESEEKYRLIFENANDLIGVINDKFEFEYVNERLVQEKLGYTREEVIGELSLNFAHPDDVEQELEYLRRGMITGEGQVEARLRRKDRKYIWFEVKGRTFRDKEGKLKGLMIARDMKERKEAELKLKESEEKFRQLFESAPNSIILTDMNGIIRDFNSITQNVFGLEKADLIDKSFQQLLTSFHPKSYPPSTKRFETFFKGTITEPLELQIQRREGISLWISIRASPLKLGDEWFIQIIIQDITKRKVAEWKLTESEEKFRSMVETTSDWVWEVNRDGIYTYASPKVKDLLGYEPEEVIGKTQFDLMPANEANRVAEIFNGIVESQKPVKALENINLHKDGHQVVLETSGVPIFDINQNLLGYRGIDRDISERKQAEIQLRESEARYKALFDRSLYCIFTHDFSGNFLDANETALNLLGYTKKEIPSLNFSSLIDDDQMPKAIKTLAEIKQHGSQKIPTEYKLRAKSGDYIWVETEASLLYHDNVPYAIQGIAKNITERKQAELKLKESEKKHRQLFEYSPYPIIITDLNGMIVDCNSATTQIIGYEKSELIGSNFQQITGVYRQADLPLLMNMFRAIYNGERPDSMELQVQKKDGTLLWITINASIVKFGDELFIQAIIQNITKRKFAEQKLRATEKEIQEKNKLAAVGQLAAGVAHELNTPLANINLTAEYITSLIEQEEPPGSDNLKTELKDIKKQVKYCSQIVKNLLQFSRKIEINPKKFNLYSLLTELIEYPAISTKIKDKDIRITVNIDKNVEILGDSQLLFQVFQNLIQNSIDALEAVSYNPQIKITLARMEKNVEIRVIDNGKGIKESDLSKIFNPFYTSKPVGKGTGLGLAISRGIIEKHRGTLVIQSTFKEGTEAIITLPLF